jgi:hypothetical protein
LICQFVNLCNALRLGKQFLSNINCPPQMSML